MLTLNVRGDFKQMLTAYYWLDDCSESMTIYVWVF